MPALPPPAQITMLDLAPRRARVVARSDVLIVGGGPAGLGAALGAGGAGAKVILVERYGFLGGNATAALVMPLMSFHTQHPRLEKEGSASLFPTDHGRGDPLIAGALKTLLDRLVAAGGASEPSLHTGYT